MVVKRKKSQDNRSMKEVPGPLPPKSSAHDRILLAGKQFFAEHGYENTSTVSIARAAQTSESQIVKHFGSKEGLLEAIFASGWGRIAEAFSAVEYLSSPSAKLQALVGLILTK